jgi:hypothetical protein
MLRGPNGVAGKNGVAGHPGAAGAPGTTPGSSGSNLPDTYRGGVYVAGGSIIIH